MRSPRGRRLLLAPFLFFAACTTTEVDPHKPKPVTPPPRAISPDQALLEIVAHEIDQFKADTGRLPVDLGELAKKPENTPGWHGPYLEAALDSQNRPITYMFTATSYKLIAVGPDGKPGTADDITWP